jgi:hypothetical protein
MATPVEKAKCVLWLESTQSVSTVQRRYQAQYGKTPPSRACVYAWYKRFSETGCLCPKSRPGSTSDDVVERVKSAFANAPDMSTRRASKELGVPSTTIHKIMRPHTHKEPRIRRYRFKVGEPQARAVSESGTATAKKAPGTIFLTSPRLWPSSLFVRSLIFILISV